MDKQQTARWNRQLKIKQVRQDYATTTVGGLVTRKFARHDQLLATADDLMATPAGRSAGATLKKSEEEKRAIAQALPFANALHLIYLEAQSDEAAHALRLKKTDYTSLSGALVLAEVRNVAKQAHAHAQALADDADLDKDDLEALDTAAQAFSTLLTAPKVAIENGKTTNTALDAALRATDEFVKKELTPAIETLKLKQPKFYEALRQAMRIDDAPSARSTDGPVVLPKTTSPTA